MSVLGLSGLQETQTEKGVSQKSLEHLTVLNSWPCATQAVTQEGKLLLGPVPTAGPEGGEDGTKREDCETKKPGRVN